MRFNKRHLLLTSLFVLASNPTGAAEHFLRAVHTTRPPTIDGVSNDPVWNDAPALTSRDPVADIDIELRAAHDGTHIFLLVRFPDPTEDRQHKTLVWSDAEERYLTGPKREDTLIIKWNMEPFPVDLTLDSDDEYLADIWFWKAHRTDPIGYADDKTHLYTRAVTKQATRLFSKGGETFYLHRDGDAGESAYQEVTYAGRVGDTAPKYSNRGPSGSRADVQAKGTWRNGSWTVEFQRRLETGHGDDLQFARGGRYEFGVSRYEIAGRHIDASTGASLYGAGEIGAPIELHLE